MSEDEVSGDLELLYQGSRYGWKEYDFHDKCDHKSETIIVIWGTDGFVFDGFADEQWKLSGGYYKYDTYFLFFLTSDASTVGAENMVIEKKIVPMLCDMVLPILRPFKVLMTSTLTLMPIKTSIHIIILELPTRFHLDRLIYF